MESEVIFNVLEKAAETGDDSSWDISSHKMKKGRRGRDDPP